MRPRVTIVAVVVLGLLSIDVGAQASKTSPEEREAILAYKLTLSRADHLIAAMDATTKYLVSLPDFQERFRKSQAMTPAERRAAMEKDPKVMAILKEHSLTAQEYLTGVPALRMALMAAQGLTTPNVIVSPENLAFAKTNLAVLKPKMDAADGRPPKH